MQILKTQVFINLIIFLQHVESLKLKIKNKITERKNTYRQIESALNCACQQRLAEIWDKKEKQQLAETTTSNYNNHSQKIKSTFGSSTIRFV